jgi:hypothetical protein
MQSSLLYLRYERITKFYFNAERGRGTRMYRSLAVAAL